jgi:hypothetical protein
VLYKNKNIPLSGPIVGKKPKRLLMEILKFLKGGSKIFEIVMTSLPNAKTPEEFGAEDEILLADYAQIATSNNVDTDDFINFDYKFEDDDVDSATKILLCTLMKSTKK